MDPKPKINQTYVILRVKEGQGFSSIQKAALRVSPVLANQRLLSLFTHSIPFNFYFSWTFLGSQLKRLQSECEDIRIEVWAKRARRHFMIGYALLPISEPENLHQNAKLFKGRLTLVSEITDENGIICPEIIVSLTTQTTLPGYTYNEVCREAELYWLKYGPESEADYMSDSSDLMEDVDFADDKNSDIETDDSSDILEPHLEEKPKNRQLFSAPQETNDPIDDLAERVASLIKLSVSVSSEERSAASVNKNKLVTNTTDVTNDAKEKLSNKNEACAEMSVKTTQTSPQRNEDLQKAIQEKIKEKMKEFQKMKESQSFPELDDFQEGLYSKNNQLRKIQSFNTMDPNERCVEDNCDDHTQQKTEFKDNKINDIHPKTNVIQPEQTQTIKNRPTEIIDLKSEDIPLTCRSDEMPFTEVNEIDVHERQDTQKTVSVADVKITTSPEPDSILYEKPIHILKRLAAIRKHALHSDNLEEKPVECTKRSVEQAASSSKLSMSSEESSAATVNKNKLVTNTMHVTNNAKEKLSNKNEACAEISVKTTHKSLISQAGMLITPNHNKMMPSEAFTAVTTNLNENHRNPNVNNSPALSEMYIDTSFKFENVEAPDGNLKSPTSSCTSDELSLNSGRTSIGYDSNLSELDGISDMTLPSIEEDIPPYEGQLPMDEPPLTKRYSENSEAVKSGEEAMEDLTSAIFDSVESEKAFTTMEYPNYLTKRYVLGLSTIIEERSVDEVEEEDEKDVKFHQFVVVMRIKSCKWYSTLKDTKTFVRLYNPSDRNILNTLKGSSMHKLDKLLRNATCHYYYICPSANLLKTINRYPPRISICKMSNNKVIMKGAVNIARLKPKLEKKRFYGNISLVTKDRQLIGKLFVIVTFEDLGVLPKNQSAHNTECFFKFATPNINEGSRNEEHQSCSMGDLKKLSQPNEVLQETQCKINEDYHKIIEEPKMNCSADNGPCNNKQDLDDQGGISDRTTFTDLTDSSSDVPEKEDSTQSHEPMECDFYDTHDPVNITGNDIIKNTFSKQDSHDKQLKENISVDMRLKIQEKVKGKIKEYQSFLNFLENYSTNNQSQKTQSFTSTCADERGMEGSYDDHTQQKAALKDNESNDTQPLQNEDLKKKIQEKKKEFQSFPELDDFQEGFNNKNNQSRKIRPLNNTDSNERCVEDNYDDHIQQKTEFKDNKISDIHFKTNVIQPEQTQTIENRPTEIIDLKSEDIPLTCRSDEMPFTEGNEIDVHERQDTQKTVSVDMATGTPDAAVKITAPSEPDSMLSEKPIHILNIEENPVECAKRSVEQAASSIKLCMFSEESSAASVNKNKLITNTMHVTNNAKEKLSNKNEACAEISDKTTQKLLISQAGMLITPNHNKMKPSEALTAVTTNLIRPEQTQTIEIRPTEIMDLKSELEQLKNQVEKQTAEQSPTAEYNLSMLLMRAKLENEELEIKYFNQLKELEKLKQNSSGTKIESSQDELEISKYDDQYEMVKKYINENPHVLYGNQYLEEQQITIQEPVNDRPCETFIQNVQAAQENTSLDEHTIADDIIKEYLKEQIRTFVSGEYRKNQETPLEIPPKHEGRSVASEGTRCEECNTYCQNCGAPNQNVLNKSSKEANVTKDLITKYIEEQIRQFLNKELLDEQEVCSKRQYLIPTNFCQMCKLKCLHYDSNLGSVNQQNKSSDEQKHPDEFIKKCFEEEILKVYNKSLEKQRPSWEIPKVNMCQCSNELFDESKVSSHIKKCLEDQILTFFKGLERPKTHSREVTPSPNYETITPSSHISHSNKQPGNCYIPNDFVKKYFEKLKDKICDKQLPEQQSPTFKELPKNKPKNIQPEIIIPEQFIKQYREEKKNLFCHKQPVESQQIHFRESSQIQSKLDALIEMTRNKSGEYKKSDDLIRKLFEENMQAVCNEQLEYQAHSENILKQGLQIPDEFIKKYLEEQRVKIRNKQSEQLQMSFSEQLSNYIQLIATVPETNHDQGYKPDEFIKKYFEEQIEIYHKQSEQQRTTKVHEQKFKISNEFIKKYLEQPRQNICNKQEERPQTLFNEEMPKNRPKGEADEMIRYSYQIPDNFKEKCFDNKLKVCIGKQSQKLEMTSQIPENKSNSPCCNTNNQSSNPQKDIHISEIRKRMQHIDTTLKKYYEERDELIRANPANCNNPVVLYMIYTINHLLSEWFKLRTELEYLLAN